MVEDLRDMDFGEHFVPRLNTEGLSQAVQDILTSYEARVREVDALRKTVTEMLSEFKKEQELLSLQLRETLSRSNSLRRKDFNLMIGDVLTKYEEKRKKVGELLDDFYKEESNRIADLMASLPGHGSVKTDELKHLIATLPTFNIEKEKNVEEMLLSLQKVRKELSDRLKGLLAKKDNLKVKDFKLAIRDIQAREKSEEVKELLEMEQEKFKNEVREMLNKVRYEQERLKTEWQKLVSTLPKGV